MHEPILKTLRRRLQADKRSLRKIALAAGLPYPVVHHFYSGKRKGLFAESAEKLAAALDLELHLRPKRKGG